MYEYGPTTQSLWPTVQGLPTPFPQIADPYLMPRLASAEFITQHPEYVAPDPAMDFLSDDGASGAERNLCTCTSTLLPAK